MKKPGTFEATVFDWGMYNEGTVFIDFRVHFGAEETETMRWFGSLKPQTDPNKRSAQEITVESMIRAGFNGDIDEFAKGNKGKAFDLVDIMLTIENNTWNNKTSLKITGINYKGAKLDEKDVKANLTPLKAAFLAAKKALASEVKKTNNLKDL